MPDSICQNIPEGKFRVVSHDIFMHTEFIVKDCDTMNEAFKLALDHNRQRDSEMDDIYYVYN